jgi:hypothetical protein
LWFDPAPDDQLQLIWLLDYFQSDPETAAKLRLRLVDFDLIVADMEAPGLRHVRVVNVTTAELETARMSWSAYRATTPQACIDLLRSDLSALPLLRRALADLLEELPSGITGLGATEMRLLELIARGYGHTNELFYLRGFGQRRVFSDWEIGFLLEGLAHCPTPAVAGLDDELRTIRKGNYRDRDAAYKRSRLSLTDFGKAILAHKQDFKPPQPDRSLVGRHEADQRSSVALESDADEAVAQEARCHASDFDGQFFKCRRPQTRRSRRSRDSD